MDLRGGQLIFHSFHLYNGADRSSVSDGGWDFRRGEKRLLIDSVDKKNRQEECSFFC